VVETASVAGTWHPSGVCVRREQPWSRTWGARAPRKAEQK